MINPTETIIETHFSDGLTTVGLLILLAPIAVAVVIVLIALALSRKKK
jgi:hypothetical protein